MGVKRSISPILRTSLVLLALAGLLLACQPPDKTAEPVTPREETPTRTATAKSGGPATRTPTPTVTLTVTTEPVAVISTASAVRRLSAAVFAGPSQPLDELLSDDAFELQPGGLVQTDASGEAEIVIDGCLKLFLFQDAELTRSTCRRDDSSSGLAVCSSAGLIGVVNNCLAAVDIQTPGAKITTNGTWFSVLYLPEQQMSVVQLYEGELGVQAVRDMQTGETMPMSTLSEGELWFTAPGDQPPFLAGVEGRTAQPLETWQAIRSELIFSSPNLSAWTSRLEQRARLENLAVPDYTAPPGGEVQIDMVGDGWENPEYREPFFQGVPWRQIWLELFQGAEVIPIVRWTDGAVEDARLLAYDQPQAAYLLGESGYYRREYDPIRVLVDQDDPYALDYANRLAAEMQKAGFYAEVFADSPASIEKMIQTYWSQTDALAIRVSVKGEAFQRP